RVWRGRGWKGICGRASNWQTDVRPVIAFRVLFKCSPCECSAIEPRRTGTVEISAAFHFQILHLLRARGGLTAHLPDEYARAYRGSDDADKGIAPISYPFRADCQ